MTCREGRRQKPRRLSSSRETLSPSLFTSLAAELKTLVPNSERVCGAQKGKCGRLVASSWTVSMAMYTQIHTRWRPEGSLECLPFLTMPSNLFSETGVAPLGLELTDSARLPGHESPRAHVSSSPG